MTAAFADTFYFLALLDSREEQHAQATKLSRDPQDRADFVAFYRSLLNHPRVNIVPADTRLFKRGVALFEQRPDKEWSLTDCLSFVVMQDKGITQALTGDHQFEQAGFTALLK